MKLSLSSIVSTGDGCVKPATRQNMAALTAPRAGQHSSHGQRRRDGCSLSQPTACHAGSSPQMEAARCHSAVGSRNHCCVTGCHRSDGLGPLQKQKHL